MLILIVLLIIAVVSLVVYLTVMKKEFKKASTQLKLIQQESLIDVTTNSIDYDYLTLIVEINKVIGEYQRVVSERDDDYQKLQDSVASLAHDLRTPLTSAKGYLQMIDLAHLSRDEARYVEIIDERLKTLSELLEELFMYTKIINHHYEIETSEFNISTLITDQVLVHYQQLKEKEIEPIIDVQDHYLFSSKELLKRVLDNLIINAINHGDKDLVIRQHQNIITVSNTVTHNNIQVDKLFDRFYKEDQARSIDSSGLGLATTKEIMNQLHSTITAEHIENKLIFTLEINNY